jgi:hypothetical protein
MNSSALQHIVDALREHGSTIKEGGATTMAQCPAHDDNNPSLSLGERSDGRGALIKCFAGCSHLDVLAALNMTESDLFDDDDLRSVLWPTQTYVYAGGRKNHRTVGSDGKKTFWQEGAGDKSLYAIDTIGDALIVYLCEGEKGADLLRRLGHAAVATGGAQRTCDLEPLKGRVVFIIADRDDAGRDWAQRHYDALKPIANFVYIFQSKVKIDKADIVEHISAGYSVNELEPVPTETKAETNGHTHEHVADPPKPKPSLEAIEQGFWDARDSLNAIYTTAMARMCPPWAVLAHTVGRALTLVRPHVTLPPLIGGPGSLNWFAAVVAPSGGGKGASSACARLLVPDHIETRNVGSGEGIIAAFGRPQDDGDPTPVHEALMFTADEVDTLAAMNQRTASTTLSILRSGFSGETLGFSYAAKEKRRHIGAHTYRMVFIVSVQPTRAGWLLDDGGGGTPQRFMWFPGTDHRISKDRPWEAGPLTLPATHEWQYPREIQIPEAAADLILDERVKAMQGDQTALDGHALYCREKLAYGLAVIDGRIEMTEEDWELSGIVAAVSAHTREQMIEAVQEASRLEAIDRGEARGIEQSAAEAAKVHEQAERKRRVLRWILNKITEAGEDGISQRDLHHAMFSRDRKFLSGALANHVANGLIRQLEGTTTWVRI